jgi:hypothetical protein
MSLQNCVLGRRFQKRGCKTQFQSHVFGEHTLRTQFWSGFFEKHTPGTRFRNRVLQKHALGTQFQSGISRNAPSELRSGSMNSPTSSLERGFYRVFSLRSVQKRRFGLSFRLNPRFQRRFMARQPQQSSQKQHSAPTAMLNTRCG